MQINRPKDKRAWFLSVLDHGFGITATLVSNLAAVICALSWFAVPHGVFFNPMSMVLVGFIFIAWLLSAIDLFRPHTWRSWIRVALVPIGACLNFVPFFTYATLGGMITSRLGNGPA